MECLFERELPMARSRRYEFQRIVLAACVIAIGWLATAHAADGALPRAGGPVDAASTAAAQSAQSDPHVNAGASPEIDEVTVTARIPPTDAELAGNSVNEFVLHHATTHYGNTPMTGNLARWRGGLRSICPQTVGLAPGFAAFVTARVRALATYVGAPVQSDPECKSNVEILFTNDPQQNMDKVTRWATGPDFQNRYAGGTRDLIKFTSDHAIQGWYLMGGGALNTEVASLNLSVWPLWPQITQNYLESGSLGCASCGTSIVIVILVVDTTKVVGYSIGTLADYLAMLSLSVAQSPDHCDPLPSILDLMSSSCSTREKPTAVTAGDLGFLKALYYKNTGLGPSLSRFQVQDNMMHQFKLH
jgi:hypothetical protein